MLPSYAGPVLVRGARIDGPGVVAFGEGPVTGHLIIPPGPTINEYPDGYREAPGGTYVQSPGCYAWQVDGTDFSYEIVFKAVRDRRQVSLPEGAKRTTAVGRTA